MLNRQRLSKQRLKRNQSQTSCNEKKDYQVHMLLEEIKNWEQNTDKNSPYPSDKLTCFDKSLMLFLITLHRYLQFICFRVLYVSILEETFYGCLSFHFFRFFLNSSRSSRSSFLYFQLCNVFFLFVFFNKCFEEIPIFFLALVNECFTILRMKEQMIAL